MATPHSSVDRIVISTNAAPKDAAPALVLGITVDVRGRWVCLSCEPAPGAGPAAAAAAATAMGLITAFPPPENQLKVEAPAVLMPLLRNLPQLYRWANELHRLIYRSIDDTPKRPDDASHTLGYRNALVDLRHSAEWEQLEHYLREVEPHLVHVGPYVEARPKGSKRHG